MRSTCEATHWQIATVAAQHRSGRIVWHMRHLWLLPTTRLDTVQRGDVAVKPSSHPSPCDTRRKCFRRYPRNTINASARRRIARLCPICEFARKLLASQPLASQPQGAAARFRGPP